MSCCNPQLHMTIGENVFGWCSNIDCKRNAARTERSPNQHVETRGRLVPIKVSNREANHRGRVAQSLLNHLDAQPRRLNFDAVEVTDTDDDNADIAYEPARKRRRF